MLYKNQQKNFIKERQKQQGFIQQKQSQLIDYVYRPISFSYKHIRCYKSCNPYTRQNMLKSAHVINHQIRQKINSTLIQESQLKNSKVIFNNLCQSKVSFEDPSANIQFVSNFESGNLQIAVKCKQNCYDLYMRPDTNTKGYYQWFYFKVKIKKAPKNHINFTIKNFSKANMLYKNGLRPYFRSLKDTIQNRKFKQIQNSQVYFRQDQQDESIFNLSYSFHFSHSNDEVEFCSQPPYSYTHLELFFKKIPASMAEKSTLCKSVMGTPLPYIYFKAKKEMKALCIAIARQHPGQSVGSWMMQGFLKYLQSNCCKKSNGSIKNADSPSKKSRDKKSLQNLICQDIHSKKQDCQVLYANDEIAWAVIPMVNIDGVILGNNRTGIMGHDFNRNWSTQQLARKKIFPEINSISSLIKKLKKQHPGKVKMFLDLHGHSSQPNVFIYGPPHQQTTQYYFLSRLFPELLAKQNTNFNLDQCSYKISQDKKKTARYMAFGVFGIPFSYTIQSTFGVFSTENNRKLATTEDFLKMGNDIAESTHKFLTLLFGKPATGVKSVQLCTMDKQKLMQQITKKYKQKIDEAHGQFDSGSQQSQKDEQRIKFEEEILGKIQETHYDDISPQKSISYSPQKLSLSYSKVHKLYRHQQIQATSNLLKTQPCQQKINSSLRVQQNKNKNIYRYKLNKKRQLENEKELSLPQIKRKKCLNELQDSPNLRRQRVNSTEQFDHTDPMPLNINDIRVRLLKLRNSKFGRNIVVVNPYGI